MNSGSKRRQWERFVVSRAQSGFTLIELLVVIAVIAILAATILIPLYQVRIKARNAAIKDDINQIRHVAEDVLDTNGGAAYCGPSLQCLSTNPRLPKLMEDVDRQNGNAGGQPQIVEDSNFCIATVLADATTYCVDSSGSITGTALQNGTSGICVNTQCQ